MLPRKLSWHYEQAVVSPGPVPALLLLGALLLGAALLLFLRLPPAPPLLQLAPLLLLTASLLLLRLELRLQVALVRELLLHQLRVLIRYEAKSHFHVFSPQPAEASVISCRVRDDLVTTD